MSESTNSRLNPPATQIAVPASEPSRLGRVLAGVHAGSKVVLGVGIVSLAGSHAGFLAGGADLGPVDVLGQPIEQLQAAPLAMSLDDFDGDGLSDAQEEALGLQPFLADSDFDGFNDGEEIARQSDPFDEWSTPNSTDISASITAHGGDTTLRLVIVMHEPAGEIGNSKVRIGALTEQGTVSVPLDRFIAFADILTSTGTDGSQVTSVDIPIHSGFVHANEHVTFFLAAGNKHQPIFSAAAKVDVMSTDNVLLLLRPVATSSTSFQQGGSIRQPIPPRSSPSVPTSWVPGAICFQRSITVGGNGATVLKEIIEAECLQGFDSYCASDCASSVNTTFRTIDPGVFIGG